jgi:class 3 adenylate cyclase
VPPRIKDELIADVATIFQGQWSQRVGRVVPGPDSIALGNDASAIDATVIYADLADSTRLVDSYPPHFAAEVYKTYLTCAAKLIKAQLGAITAYDGDRIMAVFVGDDRHTRAAICALKINWAVLDIVNPTLARQYPNRPYTVTHHVGIDASSLYVSRVGVRNDNDLVWVGPAANYAAKLSSIAEANTLFIAGAVYDGLSNAAKFGGLPSQAMWNARTWTEYPGRRIYSSTWKMNPDWYGA